MDKGETPFNLRNCAYMEDFSKQKIVWGEISDKPKFSIELNGTFMTEATTFLMVGNSLLYLTGFLNSKLSQYIFSKIGTTTGVGTVRWKKFTVEQLYVPKLSYQKEKEYNEIVLNVLNYLNNGLNYSALEKQLNDLIYNEIGLNEEEIEFIEKTS